jgi:hypothetical protein
MTCRFSPKEDLLGAFKEEQEVRRERPSLRADLWHRGGLPEPTPAGCSDGEEAGVGAVVAHHLPGLTRLPPEAERVKPEEALATESGDEWIGDEVPVEGGTGAVDEGGDGEGLDGTRSAGKSYLITVHIRDGLR